MAGRLSGVRQARRLQRVLELCDPESGSVLESVLRVQMLLAGLTGFTSQLVVPDQPGRHLRVDVGFVALGVVVEVDGARWHHEPVLDRVLTEIAAAVGCTAPSLRRVADRGWEAA